MRKCLLGTEKIETCKNAIASIDDSNLSRSSFERLAIAVDGSSLAIVRIAEGVGGRIDAQDAQLSRLTFPQTACWSAKRSRRSLQILRTDSSFARTAGLAEHAARGTKARSGIEPASRFDATDGNDDVALRRHHNCEVHDPVLFGTYQLPPSRISTGFSPEFFTRSSETTPSGETSVMVIVPATKASCRLRAQSPAQHPKELVLSVGRSLVPASRTK